MRPYNKVLLGDAANIMRDLDLPGYLHGFPEVDRSVLLMILAGKSSHAIDYQKMCFLVDSMRDAGYSDEPSKDDE